MMKKVLYIGDYYPLMNYSSVLNRKIIEELNKNGYEVYLLSKAWCEINEENFVGKVEELTENYPCKKRFFLDPIQINYYHGNNILQAFLGLACKIIKVEKIDLILYADKVEYITVVELLQKRFHLPSFLFLFDNQDIKNMYDNYTITFISEALKSFDCIYTYKNFVDSVKALVKSEKIVEAVPILIEGFEYGSMNTEIYVIDDIEKEEFIEENVRKSIALFGEKFRCNIIARNTYKAYKAFETGKECLANFIEYKMSECVIPQNSRAVYMSDIYCKQAQIGKYFLLLSYHVIPVLFEENFNLLKELFGGEEIVPNYFQVNTVFAKSIFDYFDKWRKEK